MKKSTRRGSLFGKLIGSYVIFSMAAILLLIVAVLISFVFPMETCCRRISRALR